MSAVKAAPEPSLGILHPEDGEGATRQWWTPAAIAATVTWSLWEVRATVLQVTFRDDSALHEEMVRFATARLGAGHDPLTSWFPNLGLGSPQFLHYQSTPAILTGAAGLVVGPDTAYRWSMYLLWCLWPVAIYLSARVLGLRPLAATSAAVVAPLLHSLPGIGYEQSAYLWAGFGVWTQLWASWALPFAWALTWRAMTNKRFIAPAAGLVALTAAFHYETGYLAFGAILIMPFLVRADWADLRARLTRAVALLVTALLASAWVVVPLLLYSKWAAINQALAAGPSASGYGARVTLGWLITGQLLDFGRLPVISLLAAAGLAVAIACWRRAGPERALIAMLVACLLLSFGRTTFGGLMGVVPGHADLFFRRFLMGSQLSAIYLAGLGGEEAIARGRRLAASLAAYLSARRLAWLSQAPAAVLVAFAIIYLVPAWQHSDGYAAANAAGISAQRLGQRQDAPQLAALAALLRRGGGRAYAGSPANWGQAFTIGGVPMYQYLASLDLDEVGYSLRTASLMSQPENNLDAVNAGNYSILGIRYLVVPTGQAAASVPVPSGAVSVLLTEVFQVYELHADSFFLVGDTVGSVAADRADIGSQTLPYLRSAQPGERRYLTVAYAGAHAARPTMPGTAPAAPAGTVLSARTDLADGTASATVRLRHRGVVVLSASFDPGWSVTVDGHRFATQMVTPALVGVAVPAGVHRVTFRYTGFAGYPELLGLALLALVASAWIGRRADRAPTAMLRP